MLPRDRAIELLETGSIEMEGFVPWGSNYTFLVRVCGEGEEIEAIYKPSRGERPLWDFPRGTLCLREQAAFVISEALGWHMVPPTVLRSGPQGRGSLQLFVEHDPEQHYLTFRNDFTSQIQRIVVFDYVANNADRKSGHVLLGVEERLWAIDHGVCFHKDYKLRSVIWEYAGLTIPPDLMKEMLAFQAWLAAGDHPYYAQLRELLTPKEMRALKRRLRRLIDSGEFPNPGPGRHYPWPLV